MTIARDTSQSPDSFSPSHRPAIPPSAPKRIDQSENAEAPHSAGTYPPTSRPAVVQMPTTERS